jgi:hypothetical protein
MTQKELTEQDVRDVARSEVRSVDGFLVAFVVAVAAAIALGATGLL